MPPAKCGECGADFAWNSDAGSGVCVHCGTLQDPSQYVLAADLDADDSRAGPARHWVAIPTSLKSVHGARGWNLAGQGREVTLARNKNALCQFSSELAARLGHPGLAPRAQMLFDQAMLQGQFRWGRRARLVAGACLAVAVREARKGVTMHDIAFLLNETPVPLARAFTTVVGLLGLNLTLDDPARHLPLLQTHLAGVLAEQPCPLPRNLTKILQSLPVPTVLHTANALADLISRAGALAHLPPAPTACAIFILALEGEARSSLPHCGELAKALGRRVGVGQDVVMRRYKSIYEQIEKWLADVPWVADKGAKVARRVAVARGLKDAVQFQADIWRGKLEALGRPEAEIQSDGEDSAAETRSGTDMSQAQKRKSPSPPLDARKRRRTGDSAQLDAASQFLLAPLAAVPAVGRARRRPLPALDVAAHLLTADAPRFDATPTRLQLLASARRADDIGDDELFEAGELQGFLRSADERAVLLRACDWAQEDGGVEGHTSEARARDRARGGTTRVNMDALNRLLADVEAGAAWEDGCYDEDGEWAEEPGPGLTGGSLAAGGEELSAWRPASPDAGASWDDAGRFEE